jgi:NTE family protein
MLNILTEQNVRRSLEELGPQDVLITPDLDGLGFMDFRAHERAMQAGVAATHRVAGRLAALAVAPQDYATFESGRTTLPAAPDLALPLGRIEVVGARRISAAALQAQSGLETGQTLTRAEIREAASRLDGRGDIERVETRLTDEAGRRDVSLRITEADWAFSRVRLGLELRSDFADDSGFGLVAMHVASALNPWGGEWRTVARVGTTRRLATEWWQPVGAGSPWFLSATAAHEAGAQDLYVEGRRQQRLAYGTSQGIFALGRQFGDWGELRLGWSRNTERVSVLIPQDPPLGLRFSGSSRYLQFTLDTLDPIAFPVRGQLLSLQWAQALHRDTEQLAPTSSDIVALSAFARGAWGGHVYGEWARARGTLAPTALGGFLRLSGTDPASIDGTVVVLGRLVMAREVGTLPAPVGSAIRAGFSLEIGNGFASDQDMRLSGLKQAGSAFLALDTRFGPLYLGAGATRGSRGRLYLFLGPIW